MGFPCHSVAKGPQAQGRWRDLPKVSRVPSKTVTLGPGVAVLLAQPFPGAGGGWKGSAGLGSISRPDQWRKPLLGGPGVNVSGVPLSLPQAGLRRSFRLGCRERPGSSQEGKPSMGAEAPELLTYEEVARYQQQPGERPRLVVLIGK